MTYREYPRYVQRKTERGVAYQAVSDDAERDAAFRAGWSISPRPYVHVESEPASAPAAPASSAKRGRPRKVVTHGVHDAQSSE